MAEYTIPQHGEICWRELATSDIGRAMNFYREMFGWDLIESKVAPGGYREIVMDGKSHGGMMAIDETWGPEPPPSFWSNYVAVDNCDSTVAKIKEMGGGVNHGPFDAPGVGRIAMVTDPGGAAFAIIQFETPA